MRLSSMKSGTDVRSKENTRTLEKSGVRKRLLFIEDRM